MIGYGQTPALAYNDTRGLRTLDSGPRTRQPCGFFVPVAMAELRHAFRFMGWKGGEYPNTPRRSIAVLNFQPTPH